MLSIAQYLSPHDLYTLAPFIFINQSKMLLTRLAFIKNTHIHSKYLEGNILYILQTTQCIFDVGLRIHTCNTSHSH